MSNMTRFKGAQCYGNTMHLSQKLTAIIYPKNSNTYHVEFSVKLAEKVSKMCLNKQSPSDKKYKPAVKV